MREVWTSDVLLVGGANEVVHTSIAISQRQIDRVQGFVVLVTPTGTPLLTAVPSISASGHLDVTISNTAAPGNTAHWRLDVTLNHSVQQTTSGNTGANWTIVVFNSGGGGVPAPQNLAQTYAIGTLSAHQTMTLTDANGGGVIVDGTDAGLTVPGAAFEVRASDTIATPTLLSRYGDDAVAHVLEFSKARGNFGAPADAQTGDAIGVLSFDPRINGALYAGGVSIQAVCQAVGGPTLRTSLDFYVTAPGGPNVTFLSHRIYASAANTSEFIVYGVNSNVRPDGNYEGLLGGTSHIWRAAYLGDALLYRASDDAVSSYIRFLKARNTLAAPAPVQDNDELGSIDFYGYPVAAYTQDARIVSIVTNPAPTYRTGLNFYMTHGGALGLIMEMNGDGVAGAAIVRIYNDPTVIPNVNGTGNLGANGVQWGFAHINTARIYENVCLLGGIVGGGALGTVLFQNTSTMPVPQANQVYLGSEDFSGQQGTDLAVLSISGEEPAIIGGEAPQTHLIPIRFNGVSYYLHATDNTEV